MNNGWCQTILIMAVLMLYGVSVEANNIPSDNDNSSTSQQGSAHTKSNDGSVSMPKQEGIKDKRCKIPKLERNRQNESMAKGTKSQKNRPKSVCPKTPEPKQQPEKLKQSPTITEVITKKIGCAIVLKNYIDKMGIIQIIDRLIPPGPKRKISHGEMVAGLMIYLLCGGRALYRMEQWAQETAILSYLFPKYQAYDWTDDRIADTLDALYKANLESIQGSVSSHIVDEFTIALQEIHYDTTSVSMWGTYDSTLEQPAVVITFGYSKDHRPDLKQVVLGMAVSGDGGVPIISGTHNGNTSDSVLPIPYWERLRKVAGKNPFCLIGDCKVASIETLAKICAEGGQFLAPMPMTQSEQKTILDKMAKDELDLEPVTLLKEKDRKPIYEKRTDNHSNRHKENSVAQPDSYKIQEEPLEIKDDKGHTYNLRKLLIHSEKLACQKAQTMERHLTKAEGLLLNLRQKLNKRNFTTSSAIEVAVQGILQKCKVQDLLEFEIIEQSQIVRQKVGKGRPGPDSQYTMEVKTFYDLRVRRNLSAIEEKSKLHGFFLMVTNLDDQQWASTDLLSLYKRQYKVENNFRVLKTPLAVSPMLLEKPDRICAMMCLLTFTLQLYTLIQRQATFELEHRNRPLDGLMPNKIQTWRPNTDFLLAAFDNINLVSICYEGGCSLHITGLNNLQREILEILDVPTASYMVDAISQKSEKT